MALLPALAGVTSASQEQPPTLPALQVVVLVDESGSIAEQDLEREKEAARTIAFSVLAPGSVVSVAGFGSADREGQSAVDAVCPPTKLDSAQQRDVLANCIGKLRKRGDGEGAGTDHAAALQQALSYVKGGGPEKKIVFLLTDGKLDVSGSGQYGEQGPRRNEVGAAKAREALAELEKTGAQVWPLGFGNVDVEALRGFARGTSCTPSVANPREKVVPSSAELLPAVYEAFSAAGCVAIPPPQRGDLAKGGSLELTLDIPAVASDASIVVYKRNPKVQVEYRAAGASEPAPRAGGTKFDFAGQATETESVLITDPQPGKWTIRLSSAEVSAQDVAATVMYQAAVKAVLSVSPPQPAAGETVDVTMQVWARGKAVTEPDLVRGLTFVTTLTGSAGFPAQQVTLTDPDGDGTFSGQLKVPDDATGDLTYTGQVTGVGVGGDTRVYPAKVRKDTKVSGQILFDSNRSEVTPGGTVSGTVSVTNNSGQPADLQLRLDDLSPGTTLTVDPAEVPAGTGATTAKFTLRFGQDTALGVNSGTVRLVDRADPSTVYAERLFSTDVQPPPGVLERLWYLWSALALALLVVLVWLGRRLARRRRAMQVGGLSAQLWQGGYFATEVEPGNPRGKAFQFVLVEEFTGRRLQQAGPGEPNVYEVRRVAGGVSLTAPGRQPVRLALGERTDIGGDLSIGVVDQNGAGFSDTTTVFEPPQANPFPASSTTDFGGPPAQPFAGSYDPFADGPGPAAPVNGRHASPDFGPPGGSTRSTDHHFDPNNPF
ncbi:vWA domain-containing protein [Lentzea sp. NPDC003310]|uniref:vWA domain-containing protein n=1 Tax=Lentzea sp. NPDC003310 TaxID=3154447 RepID=UPI0033AA572C